MMRECTVVKRERERQNGSHAVVRAGCEEARGCERWADSGLLVTWDDGDVQACAAAYAHI